MAELTTIAAVERELDLALRELRQLERGGASNSIAKSSIEYRIGALRLRRAQFCREWSRS